MSIKSSLFFLAIISIAFATGWDTRYEARSSKQEHAHVTSGVIIGRDSGHPIDFSPVKISIKSRSTAGVLDSLLIWGRDLENDDGNTTLIAADSDTLYIEGGEIYEGDFPLGIDSLSVFGSGSGFLIHASN